MAEQQAWMNEEEVASEPRFTHFTSDTLAGLLGLSHDWILQLCRLKLIAHHEAGGMVFFTGDDLDAIAQSRHRGRRGG